MFKTAVAIVLTMWRSPQREAMYESRIKWWKAHVNKPNAVFLLDSYGSLQNSSHVLSFNQSIHFDKKKSSSTYELFALKAAIDRWPVLRKYDYMFKITCKYVIPDLMGWIQSYNPTTSIVIQNFGNANTEVLGLHTKKMDEIISKLTSLNRVKCCIENALLEIKKQYTVTKMPRFYVPPVFKTKRGAGDILPFLR